MIDLVYVGKGRFLVGIPATSLPASAVAGLAAQHGESVITLTRRLLASGLYVKKKG